MVEAANRVHVVVHYHEIALKGRNRPFFINRLVRNIERATADLPVKRVVPLPGRLLVELGDGAAWPRLRDRLSKVAGIANFSPIQRVELDIDSLSEKVVAAVSDRPFQSFRITTRRANKRFSLNSMEIDREVGARVKAATGARVNLTSPETIIYIEILPREALFYFEKLEGIHGVPVGTAGRVAALLSGGIDSPVAAYRMMKRGCRVDFIHFHSVPFLSRASQQKVKEIIDVLTAYQYRSRLYLVAFGDLQRQIMLAAPAPLRVILYRRFMMRIATALARHRRARALVTGESLGQVASQTLDNIAVIETAAGLPVLRPLIGMDKSEITCQAREIGTYEISILPDQDCCQLFIPTHPATRSRLNEVQEAERRLEADPLVQTAVEDVEEVRFRFPAAAQPVQAS
ncbi:MAG TPA: tRNA uracil 4-sulfurtransferase ThiI [Vicinamibacteria bacterium]|nr:tRNA uracil 4-sulfurtransferase ThiI [Vicinamibacteria bacterium]